MSHKITLQPSGHEFEAEAQQTILDAALRAGINLKYSCNNGSCGDCKARLIQGIVAEDLFCDYRFSDQERLEDIKLLCRIKAGSDMTLEVHEISDCDEIPVQKITAKLKKIERLEDDFMILNLTTPRTQTLRFMAGQHVELRFSEGIKGDYSLASCPCNGRELQFHLYLNADDEVARYAFNQLLPKQDVEIVGPFGDFTYQDSSTHSKVFICLDTGFATIKSLMEHAIALEVNQPITLFWIAHHRNGHYLENYCRSWASVIDNFAYKLMSVEQDNGTWRDYGDMARELVSYLHKKTVYEMYISASDVMMSELAKALELQNIHIKTIHQAKIRGQSVF